MKKRLLCNILILFICLTSFIPLTAKADNISGVWEYTYYEEGVRITAYHGVASSLTIPDTIAGRPVLAIGTGVFQNEYQLVSVTIPETVERIQQNAFRNCKYLTSITLPRELEYLGSHAFAECERLSEVIVNSEHITEVLGAAFSEAGVESDNGITVTFSSTVEVIPKELFAPAHSPNFPRITSVTIGANVTEIKSGAFRYCADLQTVTIASGSKLEIIRSEVFRDCCSLTSINLPAGVEKIEQNAFRNCKNLLSITLPQELEYLGSHAFAECERLSEIIVDSENITQVIGAAFSEAGIESDDGIDVTFSSTAEVVPKGLFAPANSNCYPQIVSVTIGANVTEIKNDAFRYCADLETVTFASGSKLKSIGSSAFEKCENLSSITFPATLTAIKSSAFYGCESLSQVKFTGNAPTIGSNCFYNVDTTAYYPAGDSTWTSDKVKDYGGDLTWETFVQLKAPTLKVSNVASTGKIKLTWKKVDGAVKYQLVRSLDKKSWAHVTYSTGTSVTNSKTNAGKTYYYKIRAIDADGNKSEYSDVVSRMCDLTQPEVKISIVASTGKIKLSWEKVTGAVKYEVWRATSKNGTYTKLSTTTATSLTNNKVEAGKTYYYKVKAIHSNSSANSAFSEIVSGTCDLARPDVTVKTSSGNAKLSWAKISGATKYEVYRATSKNGTYKLIKSTTSASYTDKSVKSGKTYYYKVKAIHSKSAANSAYSSVDSIKIK